MLACFDNFIGLRGVCESTPPKSGLYIDDAGGGLSLEFLSSIADGADKSGADLFTKRHDFCATRVLEFVKTSANSVATFNDVVAYVQAGRFTDRYELSTNVEKGVQLRKFAGGAMQAIYVDTVTVLVATAGNYTLNIYDGITVTSYPFTAVAGVPVDVEVKYKAISPTVRVVFNQNGVTVNLGKNPYCYTGCGGSYDADFSDCYDCYNKYGFEVKGWNGTGADGYTWGVSVAANLVCDFDKYVCANTSKFAYLLYYELAIDLLGYALTSPRMNAHTRANSIEQIKLAIGRLTEEKKRSAENVKESLKYSLRSFPDKQCVLCEGIKLQSSL
jgi:hypothetical protein